MNGVVNVFRGVVRNAAGEAGGQLLLDGFHFGAHPLDHVQRVGVGQNPDAHEDRLLAVKPHLRVVILRAQLHVGHVAQPHEPVAGLADDEIAELLDGAEIGVGGQVHLDQRTLGAADGGKEIIVGQRQANLVRADVERGQAVGFEPDAHGEGAAAQDVRALHAFQRGEPGLDHADEVIGDLVRLQNVRGETQIAGGNLRVGGFDVDHGHFGLRRQVVADLVHLGADFGERLVGVVIQLEPGGDGGQAQRAARLQVFNAVGGGDGALERRGDEAAHQLGAGADIDGGDGDGGVFTARILADVERADGLETGDQNHQVHHQRQHRPPDK